MIWLGLGTAFLMWAAIGTPGKWQADWMTGVYAAAAAAGAALSLRLYDDLAVALIVASACAAAFVLRRFPPVAAQGMRGVAAIIGVAAIAFALLGPAGGLF